MIALGCFWSCEKDDICIAGDTPMMRITFVNFIDETLEKHGFTLDRILEMKNDCNLKIVIIFDG